MTASNGTRSELSQTEVPAVSRPIKLIRGLFWVLLVGVFTGVFVAGLWSVLEGPIPSKDHSPPVLREEIVPDFALTERSGRTVTRADVLGKIWLAGFVFTRCTGPCPELSLRMRSIQQALKDFPPDVKLVTFTLDPTNDTPPVLREYADRFHADPERWWFLTGADEAGMHRLIREGFLQTVIPANATEALTHSTYFVLLDRQGRVRGVYDGPDAKSKTRIIADIEALLREPWP